ncbi:pilus assembly protein N-terminal domain-containing protein [Corallococcus sp. BB11-1]|uniref:pilus assembly protein N-terminal domain-containing protein n=1 Tax=Corallococcus sp. BB11-1 TaxID=2996783 RepID=UPI00226D82AB|nr:pilus assembly protein N-terminal domain-containing protein [Corallococcus sp. BB11-1]MCY1031691.1 pilus assembly protein N-terminal domain-containing protein [Corallococcus sp. BB11-1]
MRGRRMYVIGGLLGLLAPTAALAWPVDQALTLEPGKETFQKLTAVDWAEVEDPAVASAEALSGSGELLLTAHKPGVTQMLLYAEGRFAVWRLAVGPTELENFAPQLAAAKKACPDLKATQGVDKSLTVTVKDTACRKALRELLRTEAYLARELDLTFDMPQLQAQLEDFTAGMPPGLTVRYSGAGLVLTGKTDRAGHRKALWVLFNRAVGRVPLEDRTEVEAPPKPESPPAEETVDPTVSDVPAPDAGTVPAQGKPKAVPTKKKR